MSRLIVELMQIEGDKAYITIEDGRVSIVLELSLGEIKELENILRQARGILK